MQSLSASQAHPLHGTGARLPLGHNSTSTDSQVRTMLWLPRPYTCTRTSPSQQKVPAFHPSAPVCSNAVAGLSADVQRWNFSREKNYREPFSMDTGPPTATLSWQTCKWQVHQLGSPHAPSTMGQHLATPLPGPHASATSQRKAMHSAPGAGTPHTLLPPMHPASLEGSPEHRPPAPHGSGMQPTCAGGQALTRHHTQTLPRGRAHLC